MSDTVSLQQGGTQLVVSFGKGERARLLHAGPDLATCTASDLTRLGDRQHAPGGPQVPIADSLLNTIGTGFPGPPGLLCHREGRDWAVDPRVVQVAASDLDLSIETEDRKAGIMLRHDLSIDPVSGVLTARTQITNTGAEPLDLEWLSALALPIDPRLDQVTGFAGKWAGEFQVEEAPLASGGFLRENRSGRTGHASYPGLYCAARSASETHGQAAAFHLGWSGNHRLRIDLLPDGSPSLQAGELLLPGEIRLASGESYRTPPLHCCWSHEGRGDVTRRLHRFVRAITPQRERPRPVHFNTWEAVYFDHSPDALFALAEAAAEIGAERFVLDDGWFGERRSDRAGLGDWWVSSNVYPDGLKPLSDHVRALGMEFGLWFEPEMVNRDSELFRAHPDWVLQAEGVEPIASRHQLPLDLTRSDVRDHLFAAIDALVRECGIAYIKWDMNRDIQHPGGTDGRPVLHRQVAALYALIDRLRDAHPELEIESCSSGGARADYGILTRAERVWTSDNNDARDRFAIMRGAAHFLPLSLLGNHVGPGRCHITGRRFDMAYRAGSALFGHMGIECDLVRESEDDRSLLADALALHKRHRALIHSGSYHRLETPSHLHAIGVVDGGRNKALFQIAVRDRHPHAHPPRLNFAGLDPERRYKLACVWPPQHASQPRPFAGSALMDFGLQLPQTWPDTCLIYHVESSQ
ncbi:alpha-galactosidase [Qipengyuania nanhaisediminis]|uniref:alpha-galactosidase n=1 Tax=Qipengyuania nanhaisediminis TaxID=604088 RepID=UPI0038B3C57A